MINKIRFQDYRMFQGTHTLELKPITIFIGPNNSGKSTLIRLIEYLMTMTSEETVFFPSYFSEPYSRKSRTYSDQNPSYTGIWKSYNDDSEDSYVRELVVDDLQFNGDYELGIAASIQFTYKDVVIATLDTLVSNSEYGLKKPGFKETNPHAKSEDYYELFIHLDNIYLNRKKLAGEIKGEADEFFRNLKNIIDRPWNRHLLETYYHFRGKELPVFEVSEHNDLVLPIYIGRYLDLWRDSYYSFLSCNFKDLLLLMRSNQNISPTYTDALSKVLTHVFENYILPPLSKLKNAREQMMSLSAYRGRFFEEKYSQASLAFRKLVKRYSLYLTSKSKHILTVADISGEEYRKLLAKWLQWFEIGEGLKMDHKQFEIFKIIVKEGLERYPLEVGFGNQQLLPLIISALSNPGGIFLVEEPESHLHPSMQSKLGDFFAAMIDEVQNLEETEMLKSYALFHPDSNIKLRFEKKPKSQFIIETHSEYLIRRLQYLVASKRLKPTEVSIYYLHNPNSIPSGEKQIQKMEISKDGSLSHDFGSGFFDEAINLKLDLLKLKNTGRKQ